MTAVSSEQSQRFEQLQALTREYAKYSRSAAGLGNFAGGLIGVFIFLAGAFTNPALWTRALMVLALPIWFLLKDWLRTHHYQRYGVALEELNNTNRKLERFIQGGVAGIAVVMLIVCAFLLVTNPEKIAVLPVFNKLALLAAPLAGLMFARKLNSVVEMLVAINLMIQTLMLASGTNWTWNTQVSMLFYSVLLALIGLIEHLRFRKLETQLQSLRVQP